MASHNAAAELTRQFKQNRNDIEALFSQGAETKALVLKTNTKLDNLSTRVDTLDTKVDTLTTRVDERFASVDERFARVDERFDRIDARFDRHEQLFDTIQGQMTEVLGILRGKSGQDGSGPEDRDAHVHDDKADQ